ncbi:MAG: hypothetical protein U9P44_02855, partial [archaeon]|nr:hypothetical protein [archaeon]
MDRKWLSSLFVSLAVLSAFVSVGYCPPGPLFDFYGTTYDSVGNILPVVNVTVDVYSLSEGFEFVSTHSVLSDGFGWFNLSLPDNPGYLYGASLYLDNGTHMYVSKPLPEFFAEEFKTVSPVNFYLKEGFIVNLTAVNSTGDNIPFDYQIKDTGLGYIITQDIDVDFDDPLQVSVYLQADRDYSVMLYPNATMPRSQSIVNPVANSIVDLEFNTTESLVWVSGHATLDGVSDPDFDEFYIIPYVLEPGDNLIMEYSLLPADMSAWRGDMPPTYHDEFNVTSGYFKMTLPAVPSPGMEMILFFFAENYTGEGETYGFFKDITLTYGQSDVNDFNVTLQPIAGTEDVNITQEKGADNITTLTLQVGFSLQNASGLPIDSPAFVEVEVDYTE